MREVATSVENLALPVWSPDGKWLLYTMTTDAQADIMLVKR